MSDLQPIHYKIHLEPDLSNFKFDGSTEITIMSKEPIESVELNIHKLAVWKCRAKKEEKLLECSFSLNPQN